MKICIHCNEEKSITDFEHQKNRPNPRKICKKCRYSFRDHEKEKKRHREYMKERRIREPDKLRINWERSKYGMAKEDFSYKECWVCGNLEKLNIDHCHESGKVRGLLCNPCNMALGLMKDHKENIIKLSKYLEFSPHFELDRVIYK